MMSSAKLEVLTYHNATTSYTYRQHAPKIGKVLPCDFRNM